MSDFTAPGSHTVQFYDDEPAVQDAIAKFLTHGTSPDDPLILVSRRRTFQAVAAHLTSGRHGPAVDADRILFFDAETALDQVMDGEKLDLAGAEELLKQVLSSSCSSHVQGTVRLYGELVDILCERGHHSAAIQFEALAGSLLAMQPRLSIFCGYAVERFEGDTSAAQIRAVCRAHSQVIPAGSFTNPPHARMRTFDGITPAQTVYVVDDDASIRRSLQRLLKTQGWLVRTFGSAETFLAELDTLPRGCLVVDVGLQGMSGLKLAERLTDALSWPLIVMSGMHGKKGESEALRLGARAYLRKPFDPQALVNVIGRALMWRT